MRTWGASNPQAMDAEIDLAPSDFTGKRWGWNLDFSSDFSCGEVHFFYMIYPLVNIKKYGKSPFLMGKSTISMAIFNSYVKLPEGSIIVYL